MPEFELQPPLDPSVIDQAPVAVGSQATVQSAEEVKYIQIIAELSNSLQAAEAEIERLRAKKTFDDVKAELLEPVINKVIRFVIGYCIVVGLVLILCGFNGDGFHFKLSDTILAIIAGSTAVSVIGLIGMVIGGLFGVGKPKAQ